MQNLEDFKKQYDFDNLVADIIKNRLKQKDNLDHKKLVAEVKAKVNPEMHRKLQDDFSRKSRKN